MCGSRPPDGAPWRQPCCRRSSGRRFGPRLRWIVGTAAVRDANGRLVSDLPKDAFGVYEERADGDHDVHERACAARHRAAAGTATACSAAASGHRRCRGAVPGPPAAGDGRVLPLAFNHEARARAVGWRTASDGVHDALSRLRPAGATAIYDAVKMAPSVENRPRERAARADHRRRRHRERRQPARSAPVAIQRRVRLRDRHRHRSRSRSRSVNVETLDESPARAAATPKRPRHRGARRRRRQHRRRTNPGMFGYCRNAGDGVPLDSREDDRPDAEGRARVDTSLRDVESIILHR